MKLKVFREINDAAAKYYADKKSFQHTEFLTECNNILFRHFEEYFEDNFIFSTLSFTNNGKLHLVDENNEYNGYNFYSNIARRDILVDKIKLFLKEIKDDKIISLTNILLDKNIKQDLFITKGTYNSNNQSNSANYLADILSTKIHVLQLLNLKFNDCPTEFIKQNKSKILEFAETFPNPIYNHEKEFKYGKYIWNYYDWANEYSKYNSDKNFIFHLIKPSLVDFDYNLLLSLAISRKLEADELTFVNLAMHRIVSQTALEKVEEAKQSATRAAISQVMARNTSHNIGAHVMNRLIDRKALEGLNIAKFENYKFEIELKDDANIFAQIAYFNNYIKCRMDYLSDVTFGTPMMQTNKYAYRDLYKEFDKVRLLLENITGLSDFPYKIAFTKNGKPMCEDNDLLVAIPNDILGMQAFYNILENIIRNTAKHTKRKPKEVVFTVNFRDVIDTNLSQDLLHEQSNILKELILVEIFDNVIVESNEAFENFGTNFEINYYKEILAKQENVAKETICTPKTKIDWLVFEQNEKLNSSILEESNKLRTSSLGIIEMDASAAYLRKRDVSHINHDNYTISHDDFCSCNTGRNKGGLSEKFKPKGTHCRNFLKAFKKEGISAEYCSKNEKGEIIKGEDGKCVMETKPGSVLGYRFFLLRPEVVLIVMDINEECKDDKEWKLKIDELRKAGIWIKSTDEFKNELEEGTVYAHDFVLHDSLDDFKVEVETKDRQFVKFNILEYFRTSLPLRIIKESEIKVILESFKLKVDGNENTFWEKFCWDKWNNKLESKTACKEFKEEKHFHFSVKNSFNKFACISLVLLDHLYESNGTERASSAVSSIWDKHKDKEYYIEALSSLGQAKMPKFNEITQKDCNDKPSSTEKFKCYLSYLDDIAKTKIVEAALSKIIVIDERIQEASEKDFIGIKYHELFSRMNVFIPKRKGNESQDSEISIDLAARVFDKITSNNIKKYLCKNLIPKDKALIPNIGGDDFLVIHYSILERIYGDKKSINIRLEKLASKINVIVTSGRGVPDDLCPNVRFVNLSSLMSAFVEIRSKYVIFNLLSSSRKSK